MSALGFTVTLTRLDLETFLIVGVIVALSIAGRVIYRVITGKDIPDNPFTPARDPLDMLDPINHGLSPGDIGYEPPRNDTCHVRDVEADPGHDAGCGHPINH